MLDEMEVGDVLDGTKAMRKAAEASVGPILRAAGIDEDPYEFTVELLKLGLGLQLAALATAFYVAEVGGHLDAGGSTRVAAGLALGFVSRPALNLELVGAARGV